MALIKKKRYLKKLDSKNISLINASLGVKKSIRNKQMDEYLYGFDNTSLSIYNTDKVLFLLKRSLKFISELSKDKENKILLVGSGMETQMFTRYLGSITEQPFLSNRWIKGLLTNWENICLSIKFSKVFKRKLNSKKDDINNVFSSIYRLDRIPSAIFILDINKDFDAILEAKRLSIPTIAIIENNIKIPEYIDYPILCNQNSPLSLFFVISLIRQTMKG